VNYGQRFRQIREAKGLTQAQMAKFAGCTQGAIQQIETKNYTPKMDIIGNLVRNLAVNPYIFIYENEKMLFIDNANNLLQMRSRLGKVSTKVQELANIINGEPKI
jgi:transcriptional regulator with XRE-family HTH domain